MVSATALPSASITDRWAVPPSWAAAPAPGPMPVRVAGQHRARRRSARPAARWYAGSSSCASRHRDEVGVAQVAGPVGEAVLERLGQHVKVGARLPFGQPLLLGLASSSADSTPSVSASTMPPDDGGGMDEHPQPAVGDLDRLALDHAVAPQILGQHHAAGVLAPPSRSPGRWAPIERFRAPLRAAGAGCAASAGRVTRSPGRSGGLYCSVPASTARKAATFVLAVAGRPALRHRQRQPAGDREALAASCSAGRTQSANDRLPKRLTSSASPRTSPGTPTARPPRAGTRRAPACRPPGTCSGRMRQRAPARGSRGRAHSSPWPGRPARSRRRRCPRRAG